MGTHTPGPWKFRIYALSDEDVEMARRHGMPPTRLLGNDGSATVTAGSDDDHKLVARIECQTKFKRGEGYRTECAERDANAHLIAAAPDLLDALKRMMTKFKNCARSAGNSDDVIADATEFARAAIAKAEGSEKLEASEMLSSRPSRKSSGGRS